MECGDVHVHDLDGARLPRSFRGLHCVERECHQLGASVVRYLYVYTHPFARFLSPTNQLYPAVRVQIAVMVAWPACALCIVRRLYYIASPSAVTTTRAEVRCRIIFGVAKDLLNGQSSSNRNVGRWLSIC